MIKVKPAIILFPFFIFIYLVPKITNVYVLDLDAAHVNVTWDDNGDVPCSFCTAKTIVSISLSDGNWMHSFEAGDSEHSAFVNNLTANTNYTMMLWNVITCDGQNFTSDAVTIGFKTKMNATEPEPDVPTHQGPNTGWIVGVVVIVTVVTVLVLLITISVVYCIYRNCWQSSKRKQKTTPKGSRVSGAPGGPLEDPRVSGAPEGPLEDPRVSGAPEGQLEDPRVSGAPEGPLEDPHVSGALEGPLEDPRVSGTLEGPLNPRVSGAPEGQLEDLRVSGTPEGQLNDPRVSGAPEGPFEDPRVSGAPEGPLEDPCVSGAPEGQLDDPRVSGAPEGPLEDPRVSGAPEGQLEDPCVSGAPEGQLEDPRVSGALEGPLEDPRVSGAPEGQLEDPRVSGAPEGQLDDPHVSGTPEDPHVSETQVQGQLLSDLRTPETATDGNSDSTEQYPPKETVLNIPPLNPDQVGEERETQQSFSTRPLNNISSAKQREEESLHTPQLNRRDVTARYVCFVSVQDPDFPTDKQPESSNVSMEETPSGSAEQYVFGTDPDC